MINKPSFSILQYDHKDHLWQFGICCILLNLTKGTSSRKVAEILFDRYKKPEDILQESLENLASILQPIGLHNRRSRSIKNFIEDLIVHKKVFQECRGIGQYAKDSYSIFIEENLNVDPSDYVLKMYLNEIKK